MSMKRLALIAAVGSHHHHTTHPTAPTNTAGAHISLPSPSTLSTAPTATSLARGTTDEDNFKLNAAGLGRSESPATEGSSVPIAGSEFAGGIREAGESDDGVAGGAAGSSSGSGGVYYFTEHAGGGGGLYQGHQAMRPGATLNGNVNVLLGGAMISVVITIVCVVCFCCHRNIKKRSDSFRQQQHWNDNIGANIEVYSVEQCYESSRLYDEPPQTTSTAFHLASSNHNGPPPSYDSVLAMDEFIGRPSPPPKYQQPARQAGQKCCTIARQAPLSLHTSNGYHCRRQYQQQHPSLQSRTPCSCLRSQMNHLNNARSQSHRLDQHDLDPNKTVPSPIDTLNNNVSNEDNVPTVDSSRPQFRCQLCQLCGKSQQCPDARTTTAAASDVENGNVVWEEVCSCGALETFSFHEKRHDQSGELQTSNLQVDDMNNEMPSIVVETQPAIPESSHHLNQGNPQRLQYNEQQLHNNRNHHQQQQSAHHLSNLDTFNENGIIRMDMSQIIDRTGLPTYEAAIKLVSSGYV